MPPTHVWTRMALGLLLGCAEAREMPLTTPAATPTGVTPVAPVLPAPPAPLGSSASADAGAFAPASEVPGDAAAAPLAGISVDGRRLLLNGRSIALLGVCWNPVGVGGVHPAGLDFAGFAARDIPLMQALGVNVVRTYEPLLDTAVLDQLADAGIFVINSVFPAAGSPEIAVERVRAVKDHPAILLWALGNEWNYNGLYAGLSHAAALELLVEVARRVKAEDPRHPVTTIYGELPSAATLAAMPEIDVWGINSYRGISFGELFVDWRASSTKPMFVAEYGADAFNANLPAYDPESQALAVAALSREILDNTAGLSDDGVALGGTLFEWADEWWKDAAGSAAAQDVGGIAPGGGPYPDQVFNEEWWGLVDVERAPRPAYGALGAVFSEARGR